MLLLHLILILSCQSHLSLCRLKISTVQTSDSAPVLESYFLLYPRAWEFKLERFLGE